MALNITVNGAGTFTASMEEGPVSFTASLGAVGPKGDTGATGAAGVVAATAPIVYTSGTQTVSMDTAYFVRSPAVAGTDTQILSWDGGTSRPLWIDNQTRALFMLGTNKTGTTIAKGKAVYVSGATGNHPEITLAQANTELSSARTIGITAEEIADNGTGKVIVSGRLENVNTNGFAAGDVIYLSASTAGGFTTTFPTQPNHGVLLGYITRANANTGVIEVVVKNYQELNELADVLVTSAASNDLLAWDSATSLWKNKSFTTLGLLTSATAASTYQTIAGMSSYLTTASASSTYAPIASPTFTGTVTIPAGASISGYLTTSSASSTYAPIASPTFTGTVTIPAGASISGYLTTSSASSTYAPIASPTFTGTVTIPAGASISGYLTTSTASSTYAPIASPTFTGTVTIPAGASISGFAPLASPALTGTPTAPTAAATTNTTQIATTAFVQQEVPAASTTAAGKVELATDAEAIAGQSTTLAATPSGIQQSLLTQNYQRFYGGDFLTTTVGTGGSNVAENATGRRTYGPTSSGTGSVRAYQTILPLRGAMTNTNIDWSKRVELSGRLVQVASTISTNSTYYFTLGEADTAIDDPTVRSIGVKVNGTSALQLLAHNGTTLDTVTTSFTPTVSQAFDLLVISNGSGTVEVFVNGSSVGSSTGGPTSAGTGTARNAINCRVSNNSSFTANPGQYFTFLPTVFVGN